MAHKFMIKNVENKEAEIYILSYKKLGKEKQAKILNHIETFMEVNYDKSFSDLKELNSQELKEVSIFLSGILITLKKF